jgi:hypothetical protein
MTIHSSTSTNDLMTKKYILKPGKHQFAPGSAAVHSNDSFTDDELEWYIERYPHIALLLVDPSKTTDSKDSKIKKGKVIKPTPDYV